MTQTRPTTTPPVCLTIAGLDPSGGAGIIADIKTFSTFGCFATAAVATVTFQNTLGVYGAVHQTADSVRGQVEPILDDYQVAAVKTGMLPTREIIEEVARLITMGELKNVVVDPVIRSTSGFDLIDNIALAALIELLFPLADVITPNIPEAERIAGFAIKSNADIARAAETMRSMGARNVLIKGGHLETADRGLRIADRRTDDDGHGPTGRMATDYLYIGTELSILEAEYIETTATHGTGCTLAAAIAANLALGNSLTEAVRIAKAFVNDAIRTSPGLGKGHSPINI